MVSIFAFTLLLILISFSVGGLSSGNGIVDLLYSNLSLRLMCVNNGKMYSSGGGSGLVLLGLHLARFSVLFGSGSGFGLGSVSISNFFLFFSLQMVKKSFLDIEVFFMYR